MTLHAIKKTRSKMHIGISESHTRKILNEEMSKVGLLDGDGLVLFGGQSRSFFNGLLCPNADLV